MDNLSARDTVLLADDDQVVLHVGTLMIKRFGYIALQATNGADASQMISDNVEGICFVILNMKLPDELGSNTCKRLKEIRPDWKVLHTSGFGGIRDGDSLECGCDGFLLKPFRIKELYNNLKNLLVEK